MPTIYVKATRQQVTAIARSIVGMIAGRSPDPTGEVRTLQLAAGLQALSLIKTAFLVKARGGTDETGLKWAPLAASTVRRKKKKGNKGQYRGQVEILRDTDLMYNSLSPGVNPPLQILRTEPGAAIVGTNDKKAPFHHKGTARMPQRRLWPKPSNWPKRWTERIGNTVRKGAILLLTALLRSP